MINTHASLFSGIGGAELAATWMGWQNAFHVEINPFGRKVLEYWYPNSISYEDITKTDFTPWQGKVDVLTGGFPCFVAGTPVLTRRGFVPIDEVKVGDEVLTTDKTSHPDEHRHPPCWEGKGFESGGRRHVPQQGERGDKTERSDGLHGFPWTAPDTGGDQREKCHISTVTEGQARACGGNYEELPASRWRDFPTQSPVCTGDDGFPGRLAGITFPKWRAETIKALGNSWVPAVAYEIFLAMAQVENENQMSI